MSETLTIVIPAYNEALRLPSTMEGLKAQGPAITQSGLDIREVLIVDDGSKDNTIEVAQSFAGTIPGLRVIPQVPNQGKGAAVKTGSLQAASKWILIADADMSTPWTEVIKLRQRVGTDAMAMGSRALPDSDIRVRQPGYRETMGRIFNFILRTITGLPYHDTQCGFKLLDREQTRPALEALTIARFAWDVELILLLRRQRKKIHEVATVWEHKDESRVHPVKDSLNMLYHVTRVRWHLRGP